MIAKGASVEQQPERGDRPGPVPAPAAPLVAVPPSRSWLDRLFAGVGWLRLQLAVDAVMLALALAAAVVGARRAGVSLEAEPALVAYPPLVLALLALRGTYRRRPRPLVLDAVAPVIGATSLAAMTVVAAEALLQPAVAAGGLLARAWLFATVYVAGGRALLELVGRRLRAAGIATTPTLIVGAGEVGALIARRLKARPELGLRPVGFLDADPPAEGLAGGRPAPVLGGPRDLTRVAAEQGACHVILAFAAGPDHELMRLAREWEAAGLQISIVPRLFESVNERTELEHVGGLPLLALRPVDPRSLRFAVKHGLDRVVAAVALVVLAPLLAAIAIGVKLSSPGPVLFRQRRIGRDGRHFELLKFRSMVATGPPGRGFAPGAGRAPGGVEGRDRRTRFGRLLRRAALDELPQLVNVLRGEMSLVGPRPERPEFVERFRHDVRRYADRHRVRSGVTGWAQIHGLRGQTSLADRVEWDNHYIENWSLRLDLKIVLMTIVAVARSGPDA